MGRVPNMPEMGVIYAPCSLPDPGLSNKSSLRTLRNNRQRCCFEIRQAQLELRLLQEPWLIAKGPARTVYLLANFSRLGLSWRLLRFCSTSTASSLRSNVWRAAAGVETRHYQSATRASHALHVGGALIKVVPNGLGSLRNRNLLE